MKGGGSFSGLRSSIVLAVQLTFLGAGLVLEAVIVWGWFTSPPMPPRKRSE